jgi:phosphate uptake regulator
MGALVKTMVSDVCNAAVTGDHESIKNMITRDTEVDRIYWLTFRQYNICQRDMTMHKTGSHPHIMTTCLFLSRILEYLGDHAVNAADFLQAMKAQVGVEKIGKSTQKIAEKSTALLTKALNGWVENDMVLAEQAICDAEEILAECRTILAEHSLLPDFSRTDRLMLFTAKTLTEHSKVIAEFTIDIAMD